MGSAVGAIIGAAGSIAGGLIGAKGAKSAASKATDAAMDMYFRKRDDLLPWMEGGEWGLKKLKKLIRKGPGEFRPKDQPGYNFGYKQFVEKPTLRAASALGTTRSGKTMKALSRYSQNYASTQYDQWLNRYYKKLQPYQNLASMGASAAGQTPTPNLAPYEYGGQMNATNALLAGMSGVNAAIQGGIAGYNRGEPYGMGYNPGAGWYDQPDLMKGPYPGKYGR